MVPQTSIMSLDCLYFPFLCFASVLYFLCSIFTSWYCALPMTHSTSNDFPCVSYSVTEFSLIFRWGEALSGSHLHFCLSSLHYFSPFTVLRFQILVFHCHFIYLYFFRHHSHTCCLLSIHWAFLMWSLNSLPSLIMFMIISNLCPWVDLGPNCHRRTIL